MKGKEISWPAAAIVIAFFLSIGALGATGRDTAAFIVAGMAVLGGLGLIVNQVAGAKEQATAAKEEANGKQGRLLDILERQGQMLAGMVPITPDMQRSWTSVDPRPLAEGSGEANQGVERSADQAVADQVTNEARTIGFGIHAVTPRIRSNGFVSWVEATAD